MEPINLVIQNVEDGYQASADGLQVNTSTLLGSPVPFDKGSSQHTRTITINKASSYQIKPYTITSGPMQGCQALVLVHTMPFRFLDLHPEIRDIIYNLLLSDEPTKLKLWARKSNTSKVVGEEHEPRKAAWKKNRQYDSYLDKYVNVERRMPLNLLQVNKQIYREAFEVLYRSRAFEFACSKALSRFLELNPNCGQFLTHIILPDWQSVQDGAVTVLAKARPRSLRTIELSHKSFKGFNVSDEGAAGVLEVFTRLFDTLCMARRKKKVKVYLEEVLNFSHRDCKGKGEREKCRGFEAELKELIREEYPMD